MTFPEFSLQMDRLVKNFGKPAYSEERILLFFQETKAYSSEWWKKTVDKFIGFYKTAPLVPELREHLSEERERTWQIQKKEHAQTARDFYSGRYQPDDVKTLCQYITRRMRGEVSDPDWQNFIKHLKSAAGIV